MYTYCLFLLTPVTYLHFNSSHHKPPHRFVHNFIMLCPLLKRALEQN